MTIRLWDVRTYEHLGTLTGHTDRVKSVAVQSRRHAGLRELGYDDPPMGRLSVARLRRAAERGVPAAGQRPRQARLEPVRALDDVPPDLLTSGVLVRRLRRRRRRLGRSRRRLLGLWLGLWLGRRLRLRLAAAPAAARAVARAVARALVAPRAAASSPAPRAPGRPAAGLLRGCLRGGTGKRLLTGVAAARRPSLPESSEPQPAPTKAPASATATVAVATPRRAIDLRRLLGETQDARNDHGASPLVP